MFVQPIKTKVQIVKKTPINHDSYIYRLKFIDQHFKLSIGQHFRIIQNIKTAQCPEGEQVMRKYTPISPCSSEEMEVLFKIYRAGVHPKFPNGGKLTTYIETLNVGDTINVEGPFGRFSYEKGGVIVIDGQEIPMKRIFFVAGGSGITPCYQTIMQIANMKDQTIQMILLFANKNEEDIVLRKELQSLGDRLKVHYILDNPPPNWKGYSGYVTKQILNQICPLNQKDTMYIHCGPGPMNQLIRDIMTQNYPESRIFKY